MGTCQTKQAAIDAIHRHQPSSFTGRRNRVDGGTTAINHIDNEADNETECSTCSSNESRHSNGKSVVGLERMIKARKVVGHLTSNVVHIENPFGKPIEEFYDGVHDGHILGSGNFGIVRRVKHKKTKVEYAVKCLDLEKIKTEQSRQQLREEIEIMCQLDHPNIVRLEEVYESEKEIYLVQELCLGGDLFDRLDKQPDDEEYRYTEQQCARLVKQILKAVRYIHKKGVIHRDLKLENFLFSSEDPDSELKMIDFGLSKHFEFGDVQHEAVGTPYTVAPEVICRTYDERCDMWSIGVITYLLLSGEPPFGWGFSKSSLNKVKHNILNRSFDFKPDDVWADVSEQAKNFIRSLLVTDPQKRPTAHDAQHSRWLKEWAVKETKIQDNLLNPSVVEAFIAFKEYIDIRKLLCEVLSFTLLPNQIQDLRKEFEKLDKDGSSEISLDTLKKVLMGSARARNLGALTEKEVEDIFNAMRIRKTETTIHWHEFIAAGLSQCKIDEKNLRLAFDRIDNDHKGYIIFDNIIDLMGSDSTSSEESIRKIYFDGLKDFHCNNAQITYEDFLLLMKGQTRKPSHPIPIVSFNGQTDPNLKIVSCSDAVIVSGRASIKLKAVPEVFATDDLTVDEDEIGVAFHDQPQKSFDVLADGEAKTSSLARCIFPSPDNLSHFSPPIPEPHWNEMRSQSVDFPENIGEINQSPCNSSLDFLSLADYRLYAALPEHVRDDKKSDDLINDESKAPLVVSRNLYRKHRERLLAVLEATKRFEEIQTRRILQEQQMESEMEGTGASLVMKHGDDRKLSTEEVRKILRERKKEQQRLLEKASKQAGRGKEKMERTVSDMSMMIGSPIGAIVPPHPMLSRGKTTT